MVLFSTLFYSEINARIRARKSNLYSKTLFEKLLDLDKNEFYQNIGLEKDNNMSIFEIKKTILGKYYNKAFSLCQKAPKALSELMRFYLLKFPLEEYKAALRISKENLSEYYGDKILFPSISKALTNGANDLYKIKMFKNFKRFNLMVSKGENVSVLEMEKALDNDYFEILHNKTKLFKGSERRQIELFLGFYTDTEIIMNSLRLHFFYGLSADDCILGILPLYNLKKEILYNSLSKDNIIESMKVFADSRYSFLISAESIHDAEKMIKLKKIDIARNFLIKNQFNPGILFAYIWLLENELEQIYAIIEAKLLGKIDIIRNNYV